MVAGNIPGGSGPLVAYSSQNGYLVYFSDRRGMRPDPNNGNITSGEYGFEDVINSASPTGTPDGVLEPMARTGFSPEDVDQNNLLEYGARPTLETACASPRVGNPYRL